MEEIIVDTSSILFGFANRHSVFESISKWEKRHSPLVSKGIINELGIISRNRGAKGASARAALTEISAKRIKVDSSTQYPDKWIYERACKDALAVVTNDTALARRLTRSTSVLKLSKDGTLKSFW